MSAGRGCGPHSSVLSAGIGMPGKCHSSKAPPDASKQQCLQRKYEEGKSQMGVAWEDLFMSLASLVFF